MRNAPPGGAAREGRSPAVTSPWRSEPVPREECRVCLEETALAGSVLLLTCRDSTAAVPSRRAAGARWLRVVDV